MLTRENAGPAQQQWESETAAQTAVVWPRCRSLVGQVSGQAQGRQTVPALRRVARPHPARVPTLDRWTKAS